MSGGASITWLASGIPRGQDGRAETIGKESPDPLASTRTGGLDIAHGPMPRNGHSDCGVPSTNDL